MVQLLYSCVIKKIWWFCVTKRSHIFILYWCILIIDILYWCYMSIYDYIDYICYWWYIDWYIILYYILMYIDILYWLQLSLFINMIYLFSDICTNILHICVLITLFSACLAHVLTKHTPTGSHWKCVCFSMNYAIITFSQPIWDAWGIPQISSNQTLFNLHVCLKPSATCLNFRIGPLLMNKCQCILVYIN